MTKLEDLTVVSNFGLWSPVPAVDGLVVEGEAGELMDEALGVVLEPLPRLLAPPVGQVTLSTTFSLRSSRVLDEIQPSG